MRPIRRGSRGTFCSTFDYNVDGANLRARRFTRARVRGESSPLTVTSLSIRVEKIVIVSGRCGAKFRWQCVSIDG
jgi:hypothetical protein